jgi:uncharacterized protein
VDFVWHGGEPLLIGLDFMKKAVTLQRNHFSRNKVFRNILQTNGTLINKSWASLFAAYNFTVGISMDGPPEINDKQRIWPSGKGTSSYILNAMMLLKSYKIPFGVLIVAGPNMLDGKNLLNWLNSIEVKNSVINRMRTKEVDDEIREGKWSFEDFTISIFDAWLAAGKTGLRINIIDETLSAIYGSAMQVCIGLSSCAQIIAIEPNGDAKICSRPNFRENEIIGNVLVDSFDAIRKKASVHPLKTRFNLPRCCLDCSWFNLCHGGCPLEERFNDSSISKEYSLSCPRKLWEHAKKRCTEILTH